MSSYNRDKTEALQPRISCKTAVTALSVLIYIFCLWFETTMVAGENSDKTATQHRNNPHINIMEYTNVTAKIYLSCPNNGSMTFQDYWLDVEDSG